MKKQTAGIIRAAAFAMAFAAAASVSAFAQKSATATVAVSKKPQVISIKQALTQAADFDGKRVMLVGSFMGQSGSCKGAPPVSSADVMLQDKTKLCIFVTGPLPEGYDADKRLGLGKSITLAGYVKKPKKGLPYFEVPSTSKDKKKVVSSVVASIEANKNILNKTVYPIDEVITRQALLIDKSFSVSGIYSQNMSGCDDKHAVVEGVTDYWTLSSSVVKQCLWVTGKAPAKVIPNQVATVYGTLKKMDGKLILVATEKK